jgi:sulfofructose kinase
MSQDKDRPIEVLCVGHAAFDLTFSVGRHPGPDEKMIAGATAVCGGGPAATAALAAARFGCRAAFAGYLGNDEFGRRHLAELSAAGVDTRWVVRGDAPTPVSVSLVKPDGSRALVNHRAETPRLSADALDPAECRPGIVLFDGHEPVLSASLVGPLREKGVFTLLDAGSLHSGTEQLAPMVDYLVASETFAFQYTGQRDPKKAAARLAKAAPVAVITLGGRGLVWQSADQAGKVDAFSVAAVDTTGAGDVFHGVLAACIASGKEWAWSLRCAAAAAALSCTKLGARSAVPSRADTLAFLRSAS